MDNLASDGLLERERRSIFEPSKSDIRSDKRKHFFRKKLQPFSLGGGGLVEGGEPYGSTRPNFQVTCDFARRKEPRVEAPHY